MIISAAQIRAARALLGWTQAQLAERSGLSEIGIQNIEKGASDPRASTLAAIEQAFERAGVEFTNGRQPGVRLRAAPEFKVVGPRKLQAFDGELVILADLTRDVFKRPNLSEEQHLLLALANITELSRIAAGKYARREFEMRPLGGLHCAQVEITHDDIQRDGTQLSYSVLSTADISKEMTRRTFGQSDAIERKR